MQHSPMLKHRISSCTHLRITRVSPRGVQQGACRWSLLDQRRLWRYELRPGPSPSQNTVSRTLSSKHSVRKLSEVRNATLPVVSDSPALFTDY